MENQDIYKELAEEIERLILPICQCRQENSEIPVEEFHKKCLSRELFKKRMDSIGYIYEHMIKRSYWEYGMDSEQFMAVFDECLKRYQPQGKSFLNYFISRYTLRTQDAKKYALNHKNYVDEKDGIYNDNQVKSINEATYDKDDNPNKIVSHLDKQVKADYQKKEQNSGISVIYEYAARTLKKDDLTYFRYHITSQFLLQSFVNSDNNKIANVAQPNWGDDISILLSEKITDEKLFPFIDLDFFYEQAELTPVYLEELQKEREASGKNMQEKAYLKAKYQENISKRLGMKSNRMRTKENRRLAFMSEMSKYLHM